MSWESTGTVTVTNNSNTVTGVGTIFASASRVGDAFIAPDGSLYEIDNVISNTSLSINPPYAGATQVGATYRIAPIRGYQKLAADRLFQILNTMEDSISTAVEAQLPPWVRDPLTPVPLDKGGTGGTTPASARTALELTGEWVDLRPHLKPGFYWEPTREGKNPHPQIRKLSCGRVELNGVINFNATSGPVPVGIFVNVPAPFRPTLTAAGIMFADAADPLAFGQCNWIVAGEVVYGGNGDHGDIMMIPVGLPSTVKEGAISINGIYWFT